MNNKGGFTVYFTVFYLANRTQKQLKTSKFTNKSCVVEKNVTLSHVSCFIVNSDVILIIGCKYVMVKYTTQSTEWSYLHSVLVFISDGNTGMKQRLHSLVKDHLVSWLPRVDTQLKCSMLSSHSLGTVTL